MLPGGTTIPQPQLLVFRTDTQVDDELSKAFAAVTTLQPVLHFRGELRAVIESARAFQPALMLVQLGSDLDFLRVLIEEVQACSPLTAMVGFFSLDRSGPSSSEAGLMIQALRLGVEDFVRRPFSSFDLQQLLAQRLKPRRQERAKLGVTVSFVSNKGGVGKSTVVVNVAVGLARRHPARVLLIDGSLQLGVCATHLNLRPQTTIVDAWEQRQRLDERLLRQLTTPHHSGLELLAAPADATESAGMDDATLSRILLLARRTYDYVLVDTFPLFDAVTMAILDLSDYAYIVVENIVPTMQVVRGYFGLLEQVGFPEDRQRLVLNRYTRRGTCPDRASVERYLNRQLDHWIPWENGLVQAANIGQPFMLGWHPFSRAARALQGLTDEIEQARPADRAALVAHEPPMHANPATSARDFAEGGPDESR